MSATAIRSSAPSTVDPRRTASLAGWLLIITFVVSIPAALVFYTPVLDDVRFIIGPGADSRVAMGALLEMILIVANVGSAVVLFPILKRQNETLALGYVTARIIESAFIAIGIVSLLATLTLRQDFTAGAVGDAGSFVTVGMSLVAVHDWTFLLGPGWIVGVGNGLILGYLMFTSGLVPRRMAMLGLIGGPLDHPLRDGGHLRRDRAGLHRAGHRDDPRVHLGAVAGPLPRHQGVQARPIIAGDAEPVVVDVESPALVPHAT